MLELSLWESHSCSANWFHVRLCEGQGMLEGVCKAGGGGGTCSCQLICCSWLSPSTQLVLFSSDWFQFPALFCTSTICLMMTLQRCQLSQSAPCHRVSPQRLPVSSRFTNASGTVPFLRSLGSSSSHPLSNIQVLETHNSSLCSSSSKDVPPALRMLTTSWLYSLSNFHVPLCLYVFPVPFGQFLSLYLLFNINNTHRLLGNWANRCPGAP